MTHYTQVQLERSADRGKHVYVAWIPSQYARVGRLLAIADTGVWQVTAKYGSMEAEACEDKSREYKHAFASIEGR